MIFENLVLPKNMIKKLSKQAMTLLKSLNWTMHSLSAVLLLVIGSFKVVVEYIIDNYINTTS